MKRINGTEYFSAKKTSFGGMLLKKANARSARPISTKSYLHVVMYSEFAKRSQKQSDKLSIKKNKIIQIIQKDLLSYGIRIHRLTIASSHIQLVISLKSKKKFFNWIRKVTGVIARTMLTAEKGSPNKYSFWSQRPFTQIISKGREYWGLTRYLRLKHTQAIGFVPSLPLNFPLFSSA